MELLCIDVGRGTQDVLLARPGTLLENSPQLVLPSRTEVVSGLVRERVLRRESVLLKGRTMGGFPLPREIEAYLTNGARLFATWEAARSLSDNPERVRSMGVTVVGEGEAERLERRGVPTIETFDVDLPGLLKALGSLGVACRPTGVAVAVQDHGVPPRGGSERRFRFETYRERLKARPGLAAQSYLGDEVPPAFTRMQSLLSQLQESCEAENFLIMDTGFAKLLGALEDEKVRAARLKLLLNVGNGHTLSALMEEERVVGLFEHHTGLLTGEHLARFLRELADGSLTDEAIYRDGGHGAYLEEGHPFGGLEDLDLLALLGPRRELVRVFFDFHAVAPYGNMMLTGAFGLMRSFMVRLGERVPSSGRRGEGRIT